MATLLFYEEPVALDREAHKALRLKSVDDLSFAAKVNAVPVAGVEFFEAGRDWPVLFTRAQNEEYVPVAVLSLRQEGNDLKTRAAEVYLPAFIRRYPFALSDDGVVVFDRKSVFIGEDPEGRPLFNDDGSNSKLLDDILRFLYFMDEQYKRTREFCQALAEAEMLVPFNATVRLGQERNLRMDSLWMIDQKKLDALDDGKVVEFYRKGWLAWAIAHLASIGALARLAQRQSRAGEAAQTGAA